MAFIATSLHEEFIAQVIRISDVVINLIIMLFSLKILNTLEDASFKLVYEKLSLAYKSNN